MYVKTKKMSRNTSWQRTTTTTSASSMLALSGAVLLLFALQYDTCTAANAINAAPPASPPLVPLIVDTDAGFDVDDIGALSVANALADAGEAEIIAVGHTNGYALGIGAVSAVMQFYGRESVPLGAYKGPWARNPNAGKGTADKYVSDLVKHYPSLVKNYTQVPTAVETYRRALVGAADHSVRIASIGITTNMRDLITSPPDDVSPLSGRDLVAQKVKLVVWMDGMYNFGCAQHDSDNWLGPDTDCRGSAKAAVENWPSNVQQIFTLVGGDVLHGSWLTGCAGHGNPVRQAFEDWLGPGNGRCSWDPITVLIAVRGAGGVHCKEVDTGGHMTLDEAGHETWHEGTGSNQSRIVYEGTNAQAAISFELNELLCKPPGPWSSTNWTEAVGENCYGPRGTSPSHGATDLEHPASSSCGTMSLDACRAKCLNTPGCTAVATSPATVAAANESTNDNGGISNSGGGGGGGGSDSLVACYRKADISLEHCDSGTTFSTHVRRQWVLAGGFNCWPGHGAKDVGPNGGGSVGVLSVRACQIKCEATPGCSGVVFQGKAHSGVGNCYLKSDIVPAQCDHGTTFDTYLAATAF